MKPYRYISRLRFTASARLARISQTCKKLKIGTTSPAEMFYNGAEGT